MRKGRGTLLVIRGGKLGEIRRAPGAWEKTSEGHVTQMMNWKGYRFHIQSDRDGKILTRRGWKCNACSICGLLQGKKCIYYSKGRKGAFIEKKPNLISLRKGK